MRIAVATSIAAITATSFASLVGCNQIYGLDKTDVWDGGMLPGGTVRLSLRHAGTDASGAATAPANAPLVDLDTVHYGALGAPLDGDPIAIPDGPTSELAVPGTVFRMPWRLVLQRTGQVPHEYQFAANLEDMHVIVTQYSRTERRPVPDTDGGAAIAVQPVGYSAPTAPEHHRVYSTGIWSATDVSVNGQFQLFFDCPAGTPCMLPSFLDGAGVPEIARGDRYLAVDLDNVDVEGTCRRAVGLADFQVDLVDGSIARPMPEPPWLVEPATAATLTTPDLTTLLGDLPDEGGQQFRYRFGYAPSDALPAFAAPPPRDFALPALPMLSLLECVAGPTDPRYVHSEILDMRFPTVAHAELVRFHTRANAPTLANGLAVLVPTTNGRATIEQLAPLPAGFQLGSAAIATGAARISVPGDQLHTLAFDRAPAADYHEIYLHEVVGTQLALRRVFTVPNHVTDGSSTEPVTVDLRATALAPGAEYVFEVRAFIGRATARTGNFETANVRQSMAVVHSGTFVVAN